MRQQRSTRRVEGAMAKVMINPVATTAERQSDGPPSPGCDASVDNLPWLANRSSRRHVRRRAKVGAGNGIRTRDFDLGKVALYH